MTGDELAELLGTGAFRFRMALARAELGAFLAGRPGSPDAAAARDLCAARHPERFALDPDSPDAGLAALAALERAAGREPSDEAPGVRLATLAAALRADLLLVARAELRVVGVAVAFPSGFAPERLLGRTISGVHRVVPGLEAELGASIGRFLDELPAGRAYARTNVGLAEGDALDRHPAIPRPPLDAVPTSALRLRIERQCFVGLDDASIAFLIGVEQPALAPLLEDRTAARALARWLDTMPAEVARYKGLEGVRPRLLAELTAEAGRIG